MDQFDPRALAQQNTYWQALKDRLMPQGLLGSGMAQNTSSLLQSTPYLKHVQEMKALGMQPLTPEQFAAQMR